MSTGWKFKQSGRGCWSCAPRFVRGTASAADATTQSHRKAGRSRHHLPPLPSGPTGPVQPIPLDSMTPVPPQVSYQNGQLTIVAPNSTLGDILRAVRKQTGAEIEIPAATERVVTHLGPGPAREVVAELLNGSRFNYVLLGSAGNDGVLTRVVLVAKTGLDNGNAANGAAFAEQQQPGNRAARTPGNRKIQDTKRMTPQSTTTPTTLQTRQQQQRRNSRHNKLPASRAAAAGVKTPQELLQEMQQRQLLLQQQQTPGNHLFRVQSACHNGSSRRDQQ